MKEKIKKERLFFMNMLAKTEILISKAKKMNDELKMYAITPDDTIERVWYAIEAEIIMAKTELALDLFDDMCDVENIDGIGDEDIGYWMTWDYRTDSWKRLNVMGGWN
jgi:hypothetical protein